jgi:Ca-activated chloride channel homolog
VKALPTALLVAVSGLLALPPQWRHNPRERTATGLEAWREGDHSAAAAALAEALELAPEEPLLLYNAGTGRLGAGELDPAVALLAKAAAEGDAAIVPDAFYNLGNALLDGGDAGAAVEAYKWALRSDPGHAAAKHNLELALRQQEQQGGGEGQQPEAGDEGGGGAGGEARDARGSGDADSNPGAPDGPGEAGGQPEPDPHAGGPPDPGTRLPDFRDQDDMTAEQAASLLEAVEGLEREQRRARAEEQRRQRSFRLGVERDW